MAFIALKINGVPYCKNKARGDREARDKWEKDVIEQTKSLQAVNKACNMRVVFCLPENKFPSDLPYGSDLDNLIKIFNDSLGRTIFKDAPGKDSCIVSLCVEKKRLNDCDDKKAGAYLEIDLVDE